MSKHAQNINTDAPGAEGKKHMAGLEAILDQYTEWFMEIVRGIFYPQEKLEKLFHPPSVFAEWSALAAEKKLFPAETLGKLNALHADLQRQAKSLVTDAQSKTQAPPYDEFDKLATYFEEFVALLRRLEKEFLLGESGIDPRSGLRSKAMFYADVQRELDRIERQGKPFALALVQIDNFSDIKAALNDSAIHDLYRLLAALIGKSTRSFDDAYVLEDGVFVIILKQANSSGGLRALQRLSTSLRREGQSVNAPSGKMDITLSSCISEPLPNDDIKSLLDNMRKDIVVYPGQGGGALIEYVDISPLQRLAKKDS